MFKSSDVIAANMVIYMIVCSRGPGSETLTARVWKDVKMAGVCLDPDDGSKESVDATLRASIEAGGEEVIAGVSELDSEWNDEGMTYLVKKGVKYGDMLKAIVEHEVGWQDGDDDDPVNVELASVWKTESMRTAFFRALVANLDGDYGEETTWSSYKGWRNVKCELMPRWMWEMYVELFGDEGECPVLRDSKELNVIDLKYSGC